MSRYIVVVSPSYGGAEKRFFDIFTALRRQHADLHYVAPSMLIERLKADHPERADVFAGMIAIALERWSPFGMVVSYARWLRRLPKRLTFHYPMNCLWFLHIGRADALSLSFVDCTIAPSLSAPTLSARLCYIAAFFVRRLDILSPSIFSIVRKMRSGSKATLTPGGTFLIPPDGIQSAKKPRITFFSRLVEQKGALDFLRVAKPLWEALRTRVPQDFRIVVAGYGELEKRVAELSADLKAGGVPIDFVGYKTSEEVVRESAILLSLQRSTNYPSRVVAEGLIAGCAVIVRNTGDSTEFGYDLPGLVYCREPLDPRELADLVASLIAKMSCDARFPLTIHEAAVARFRSEGYLKYFDDLISP